VLAGPGLIRGGGRVSPSAAFPATVYSGVADLPAGSSFTRASGTSRLGPRGMLEAVGNDVLAMEYLPGATFNAAQNPWLDGAVVPATFPAPVTTTSVAGLAWSIADVGVEAGDAYVDFRLSGVAAANNHATLRPFGISTVPGRIGEQWTGALRARVVGTALGIDWFRMNMMEFTLAGGNPAQDGASSPQFQMGTTDAVYARARTLTDATTEFVGLALDLRVSNGATVDCIVRVKGTCINPGATSLLAAPGVVPTLQRVNTVPQLNADGIQMGGAATNLCLYSESLLNAGGWVAPANWSGTAGYPSPRGDTAAMLFDEGAANAAHVLSTNAALSVTSGSRYVVSIFIKPSGSPFWQVGFGSAEFGVDAYACFDLSGAGSVSFAGAAAVVPQVQALPFGWFRVSLGAPATSTAATASAYACPLPDGATTTRQPAFAGTSRTARLFGCQVELGTNLTPYLATGAATASRVRDLLRLGAVDGVTDGAQDTWALGITFLWSGSANGFMFEAGAAVASDGFTAQINALSNPAVRAYDNGVLVGGAFGAGVMPYRTRAGVCFAYGGGSCLASWNGAVPTLDASCPSTDPASGTRVSIGGGNTGAIIGAWWIWRSLAVWRGRKLSPLQVAQQSAAAM
jgi:hypothetical protein